MRYCAYCKRLNVGSPTFCQYCGRSFNVRICKGCGHMNPTGALACRKCGRSNLSEPSGSSSPCLTLFKWFGWILVILFLVNLIKAMLTNLELFSAFLISFGCFYFVYLFLPQALKGLMKRIFGSIKSLFMNKTE